MLPIPYEAGDGFALGNAAKDPPGTPSVEEEVIHAEGDGTITIYHHMDPVASFASGFEPGDGFAAGDVFGNGGPEEVVIADISHDQILVHDVEVGSFAFACADPSLDLAPEDALAVGNVLGDSREEIIIADESEDQIRVYGFSSPMVCVRLADYAFAFQPEDSLAVGDFYWAGYDEVAVACGRSSGLHRRGDVDLFSCLPGDPPGDRRSLDTLINEGGAWAVQLAGDWTENGYLLLVGEQEIIPAFSDHFYLTWSLSHGDVDYTDAPHGNIRGNSAHPELSMGRIIGDSPALLRLPIQASIAVARGEASFDNSDGYAVSGYPKGHDDSAAAWINYREVRNQVARTLRGEGFIVDEDHTPDETEFFAEVPDKDVIFMGGHGNWSVWDYITTGDVSAHLTTGDCHPLVVAESCLTGRYPRGYSLAESFLERGAAAYLGATEVTISPWSRRLVEHFFYKFDPTRSTIGLALRDAKRDRYDDGSVDWDPNYLHFTNKSMELYGDPKSAPTWLAAAGALEEGSRPSSGNAQAPTAPLAFIPVTVPDYEVTLISDTHHAEIPGGDLVLVPYKPQVPSYQVRVGYPPGTEIQDVILVQKGSQVWDTGLNLALALPKENGPQGAQVEAQPSGPQPWPDKDFSWLTIPGPSDTLMLTLSLYPFQYYTETTNAAFSKDWAFEVETAASPVAIHSFWLDRFSYAPGQPVEAHVYLYSTAQQPVDVVVDARVRSDSRAEIVEGLPLRTLHAVQGLASFSLVWESANFEPGRYSLEITVRDSDGVQLDQESRALRLGIASAALTGLSATPENVDPGQQVAISFDVENTGTEVVSGTATLRVSDESGEVMLEHRHSVANLVPGQATAIDDIWDTSEAAPGTYRIVATVAYDGRIAGPVMVEVQCGREAYLPFITRGSANDR